jgi:hypothetical protein
VSLQTLLDDQTRLAESLRQDGSERRSRLFSSVRSGHRQASPAAVSTSRWSDQLRTSSPSVVRRTSRVSSTRSRSKSVSKKKRATAKAGSVSTALSALDVSMSRGGVHEQLMRAYNGEVPFLPGPSVPTHSAIGNAQIALGRAEMYGRDPEDTRDSDGELR